MDLDRSEPLEWREGIMSNALRIWEGKGEIRLHTFGTGRAWQEIFNLMTKVWHHPNQGTYRPKQIARR